MKTLLARASASVSLRLGAGVLVSALSLYLAVRNVSFTSVRAALLQGNALYFWLALFTVFATHAFKGLRWRALLGPSESKAGFNRIFGSLMAGQLANLVYPGRVGDLGRAYIVGGSGPGRVFTLGTVMLEKVFDLLAYALLFVLLLLLIPLPGWMNGSIYLLVIISAVFSLSVYFIAWRRAWVSSILEKLFRFLPASRRSEVLGHLSSGLDSLDVLRRRGALAGVTLYTLLIWGAAILTNHFALLAFDIQLPLSASLLLLIALQAGITLPSVPGRIGIFEYICVLSLAVYSIEQAPAVTFGIFLHVVVMAPLFVIGGVYFFWLGLRGTSFKQAVRSGGRYASDPASAFPMHSISKGELPAGKVDVLGVRVDPVRVGEVTAFIERTIASGDQALICHVNVRGANLAFEHAWFRQILNRADLLTCDGMGVKFGAQLLGENIPERFTLADWMYPLADFLQAHRYSVYFLGNPPGTPEKAAQQLLKRCPQLCIAGTQHGFFNKQTGHPENEAVIHHINTVRPDILLVGFGMPEQEKWLDENWRRLHISVGMTCGGLFEYISGEKRRGPRWMTDHYLEWLARLMLFPRRYGWRYVRDNPLFMVRVLKQRITLWYNSASKSPGPPEETAAGMEDAAY